MNTPFKLRLRIPSHLVGVREPEPDYLEFVRALVEPNAPLCGGILSDWDRMRLRCGAIDAKEALALAHELADHLRRTYPALFGVRR